MECQGFLAALDHNHHVHLPFKVDSQGEPLLKKKYNERSKSFSVTGVRAGKDYFFVRGLLQLVLHNARSATVPDAYANATFSPQNISVVRVERRAFSKEAVTFKPGLQ